MGIKKSVVSSIKRPMMVFLKFLIKIFIIIGLLVGSAIGIVHGLDMLWVWLIELVSTA